MIRTCCDKHGESVGEATEMESDFRYYSRRAAEERTRAERAITDEAKMRHRELAKMFATRAAQRSEEQYANS
ncbi:MAG: hypothetical protein ACT4N8_10920 [Sphingosinicella sp.]|uniref:hypothetical protein n=1 Tax=Sphingosinicella sp. TaxID=1917971 RepID=UPI0040376AAF